MRELYASMDQWQKANNRRLLSLSVQQDRGNYCCIALTNPTEVVITSADGKKHAHITGYPFTNQSCLAVVTTPQS